MNNDINPRRRRVKATPYCALIRMLEGHPSRATAPLDGQK
jgi:hypothetical protein